MTAIDRVLHFEYLDSRLHCDRDDDADVRHRVDMAQSTFRSLNHQRLTTTTPPLAHNEAAPFTDFACARS